MSPAIKKALDAHTLESDFSDGLTTTESSRFRALIKSSGPWHVWFPRFPAFASRNRPRIMTFEGQLAKKRPRPSKARALAPGKCGYRLARAVRIGDGLGARYSGIPCGHPRPGVPEWVTPGSCSLEPVRPPSALEYRNGYAWGRAVWILS